MNRIPTSEGRSGRLFWVLASLWSLLVLVYYYKSIGTAFDDIPAAFNGDTFPPVEISKTLKIWEKSCLIFAVTFLISIITMVWGRRIRLFFSLQPDNSWLSWGMDFGMGIIFFDILWLGTGLTRLWFGFPLKAIGVLLGLDGIWVLVRQWREKIKGPSRFRFPREWSAWLLVFGGTFYWLFSLAHGLVPETFYDSMVYHLAVPQYWFSKHGISDFSTNFFSNYPYGGELFYFNGLIFKGTETAKMLHAVAFGFCALFAGGWAREMGGEKAGWITLGLVLTLPLFAVNIWSTQVEGLLALALLLFLYSTYRGLRDGQFSTTWITATGFFMALAYSIKYTAALMVASAFLALTFLKSHQLRRFHFRHWIGFSFGAILLVGPWIIKSLVFTGDPFFPYFTSIFDGRHLTPAAYQALLTEQQGRIAQGWQWLYLPWKAVMANPDGFDFSGPVALAFIPFLFLFKLRHPALKFLSLVALFFFPFGFLATHILRFLGTGFVLIYILLGGVLGGGDKPHWGKVLAFAGAVSAILSFGYLSAISARYSGCAGVWYGRQTRDDYLTSPGKITPYFSMAEWVSNNTSRDAGLLIVGDARGLYYDRPFLTNSVFDTQELALFARQEKDAQGIGRRLKEEGIDYLVVNGPEGIRVSSDYHHYDLTPDEWKKLDGFIQRNTEIVYQRNYQVVYHLIPSSQTKNPTEIFDLVLFFSKPASEFIKNAQSHQWGKAEECLSAVLKLYPFSEFWKAQKAQFDKAMGNIQQS